MLTRSTVVLCALLLTIAAVAAGQTTLTVNSTSLTADITDFQVGSANKVQIDAAGDIIVTGNLAFNTAGGTLTLAPVTGTLGLVTASFPANTGTVAELNATQTFTATDTFSGAVVLSYPSTASTSAVSVTGAPFTGGSGTTTLPQTYLDASANNPTTFSTSGTMLGINAPSGFAGNLMDFFIGSSTPAHEFTMNGSGVVSRYNGNGTVDLGVPSILGTLDQTGVSSANSGLAQNVLASTPAAGHYRLFYYADESGGCVTIGSAALTISAGWTDATHARVSPTTSFPPATLSNGTGLFTQNTVDFWAAATTAVTVTATYAACSSGPWTYDLHAYVEEVK